MSLIKVDFPEPLTPVTQSKENNGMSTDTFCKLFSRAPMIFIQLCGLRLVEGIGMTRSLVKYCAVRLKRYYWFSWIFAFGDRRI